MGIATAAMPGHHRPIQTKKVNTRPPFIPDNHYDIAIRLGQVGSARYNSAIVWTRAPAAILMGRKTRTRLTLSPASLTKLMTLYNDVRALRDRRLQRGQYITSLRLGCVSMMAAQ